MIIYDGSSEHDVLLTLWYRDMRENEELELAFASPLHEFDVWLEFWKSDTRRLLFDIDDVGMPWIAVWLEPIFTGALFSLWVRKDRRNSKATLAAIHTVMRVAFEHFPLLLGLTRSERVSRAHKHFGMHVVGSIPQLFDGHEAWISYMTKEMYDGRRASEQQ